MKQKVFATEAAALIVGTTIASGIQTTDAHLDPHNIERYEEGGLNSMIRKFLILGFGNCGGISIDGKLGDIEGKINADLVIQNCPPYIQPIGFHMLWAYNFETGKILNKRNLPEQIFISDFSGVGLIDNYYNPVGPIGATFRLIGTATYCT